MGVMERGAEGQWWRMNRVVRGGWVWREERGGGTLSEALQLLEAKAARLRARGRDPYAARLGGRVLSGGWEGGRRRVGSVSSECQAWVDEGREEESVPV